MAVSQPRRAATGHGERVPARRGADLEAGCDPVQLRLWRRAECADVIAHTNVA